MSPTTGPSAAKTASKLVSNGEKSKSADQSFILCDASRKKPVISKMISPRCRMMFVPVSPATHAASNCVARLATVHARLATVISRSSVIRFPYPSIFQTCIKEAPTSPASCFIAVKAALTASVTSGPFSFHDSFSGSNKSENVFFISAARSFISFGTSSVLNI